MGNSYNAEEEYQRQKNQHFEQEAQEAARKREKYDRNKGRCFCFHTWVYESRFQYEYPDRKSYRYCEKCKKFEWYGPWGWQLSTETGSADWAKEYWDEYYGGGYRP